MNNFSFFGGSKTAEETTKKCPYSETQATREEQSTKCPYSGTKSEDSKSKCPYSGKEKSEEKKEEEKEKEKTNGDVSSDDDDKPRGGCPVMNKTKKDPPNKHFDPSYEIGRFGPFDFIFDLRGGLSKEDFLQQTQNIRSYPRHMKYTLFLNDDKLKQIRTKEFPLVFFVYDEVKDKGNKLFKKKKFRESIEYYVYAYSMLKWIEFKDSKKKAEFLTVPSLDPVLDTDIQECKVFLDDVAVEEDSYKACVVYLLMCLSYSYIELRHYSEAIACLDECIGIAGNKVPDLYFRRSQARTLNKCSNDEQLQLAKEDIEKAISLKKEIIYVEHQDRLKKIMEERKATFLSKMEGLIGKAKSSYAKMKERGLNIKDCIFNNKDDQVTQYKILKEMENKYHLAIKFFTETKNDEQLNIAYKEIDAFMQTYENFLFYYSFDPKNIATKYYEMLSEESRTLLNDDNIIQIVNEFRYKTADTIFGEGNYNFALYKYALEKICEEERKEKEELEKEERAKHPKTSFFAFLENKNSNLYLFISLGIVLFTVILAGANYYYSYANSRLLNKPK